MKDRKRERQAYKQRQPIGLYKRNMKHKAREKWKERHKENDEQKDILFGKEREREIQTNRMIDRLTFRFSVITMQQIDTSKLETRKEKER